MGGYRMVAVLLGGTLLSGCATMDGNVKGSFSCVAPDGICAPSSVIDDRALALISGEDGDRIIQPAGPYRPDRSEGRGFDLAANGATRTGEKVLRIVFPAHIDDQGRLHERTAVHAVVERGDWRQAGTGDAVATDRAEVDRATGGVTLLAAVEAVEAATPLPGVVDSDLPSAAAIDAARARAPSGQASAAPADPVGAIKREVAGVLRAPRLAVDPAVTRGGTVPTSRGGSAVPTPVGSPARPGAMVRGATKPLSGPASSVHPVPSQRIAPATGTIIPAQATPEGRQAVTALGASPVLRAATAQVEQDARAARPSPTVRAPSFPGLSGDER